MLESKWKIDLRHMKEIIEADYLFMLDLHKRNVAFILAVGLRRRERRITKTHFEDYSVNEFYKGVINDIEKMSFSDLEQYVMNYMRSLSNVEMMVFNDISLYMDRFIELCVKDIGNNIISITFSKDYELLVTINCITRLKVFGKGVNTYNCSVG